MVGTRLAARLPGDNRAPWVLYVIAGLVAVGVVVFALRVQSTPRMVRHVTVRNTTPYEVTIQASSTAAGSVTPLGIVPREATETFSDVIDAGPTWYFHVTCSGVGAGTMTRTRAELAASGWQVTVGPDAEARCRAAGLVPVAS
ncbi:MAG TPA: hypothetical protein VMU14_17910 [Acidimicrobiales bacterium]|nr:hypothetical protein [Acidimicrobiales bacterium]